MLDLILLRSFLAVLDHGGFTGAARAIHKTQSTISLHIQRLEHAVGHPLFERGGRRATLTERGEVLRVYAEAMIGLNNEAMLKLRRPTAVGSVRLGILEDFATEMLPTALRRFKDAYPGARLMVRSALTADLQRELDNGELDIVVVRRQDKSTDGETLWREPLRWVAAPHAAFAEGPVPLVMFPSGCVYRSEVLRRLRAGPREWEIVYTSTSLGGVQAAVAAGVGVSVLGQSAVLSDFAVLGAAEQLPELPDTEIVMRRGSARGEVISALGDYLAAALPGVGVNASRLIWSDRNRGMAGPTMPRPSL